MKYSISPILLLVVCASVAVAADDKSPDTSDYRIQTQNRMQIAGTFDESTPIWQRPNSPSGTEPTPETCDHAFTDGTYDDQRYTAFCVTSTDTEPVEFVLTIDSTTLYDPTLSIFCADFDPSLPLENGVFYDDDDGEGFLSAITAADGVVLTPGAEYWLVISNYGSGGGNDFEFGDYVIHTSDNVMLCGTVSAESRDWSGIKDLFR